MEEDKRTIEQKEESLPELVIKNEFEDKKAELSSKILAWMKNPYNLILVLILLSAFIIRIYYLSMTYNQPLWWDEACYGSLAKNMISHMWEGTPLILGETHIRHPLFHILWSIFMRIGLNEEINRFLLEIIPSMFSIFFVFLIGKELYNKRIGIIASFIFSILWIHLFYVNRILVHMPELAFLFVSIFFFIKATKNEFNSKYFGLSLFLLSIATLVRYTNGMIFFVYLIMLFVNKKFLIKDKKFWVYGILGLLPILIFFLINQIYYGNPFPALLGGNYINTNPSGLEKVPFYWGFLDYITIYLSTNSFSNILNVNNILFSLLFLSFLFGVFISIFELFLGYTLILKNDKLKNSLFLLLIIAIILSFFIFYLRAGEDRYLFPASISLVCFSAIGLDKFYIFLKKYNKILAILVILAILLIGFYGQIRFGDSLIKNRMESFLQIRQGFEWVSQNTPSDAVFIGNGIEPYLIYYAERKHLTMPENISQADEIEKADYLVVHAFTPQASYINDYLQSNKDKWNPINAWFFDKNQQQPAFVIYKRI